MSFKIWVLGGGGEKNKNEMKLGDAYYSVKKWSSGLFSRILNIKL